MSGSAFRPTSIDAPKAPPITPPMTNTALTSPLRLNLAAYFARSMRSGVGVAPDVGAGWLILGGTEAWVAGMVSKSNPQLRQKRKKPTRGVPQ